jgi:hypothetical protein
LLPTKFQFIWLSGFREEEFKKIVQAETRIACGCHVYKRIKTKYAIFFRGSSIDASYQVSLHLA